MAKPTSVVPKGLFLANGSTANATHATKPILPEFAVVSANDGRNKPILPEFAVVSANDGRTKPILLEFAVVSANDGRMSKTVWHPLKITRRFET